MSRTVGVPEGERLQKVMARAAVASRRGAEDLIRQGRVTINGSVAQLGQRVKESDSIKVDGRRIAAAVEKRYFLIHKPRETMTTTSDPEGRKTVLDLVPARLRRGLFPVGRLDYHTEGLLLLTTDGDFAQRVGHPRYGCVKLYEAKVRGVPSPDSIERLARGIVIAGKKTAPCTIVRHAPSGRVRAESTNSWWRVELRQGMTRQVREMFQRIGHPVQRLKRVAIGGVRDPRLRVGEVRELRPAEIDRLLDASSSPPSSARKPSAQKPKSPGKTGRPPSAGSANSGSRRPTRKRDRKPPG